MQLLTELLSRGVETEREVARDRGAEAAAKPTVKRTVGAADKLSGAGGLYMEVSSQPGKPKGSIFDAKPRQHKVLKKLLK